jgi:hypothetical protein
MKIRCKKRHEPILTALKEAGFKVDTVEQEEKKTVITVTPAEQNTESSKSHVTGNSEKKNKQ